jgi:hypothetical protein
MTLYQIQICLPDGRWIPAPEPHTYRSRTAATIAGLRAFSARDIRVMPVEDGQHGDADAENRTKYLREVAANWGEQSEIRYRDLGAVMAAAGMRVTYVDGQPVIATANVTDERIRDEIARRRERENQNGNENGEEQENG